jgi:hypothetical protein
MVPPTFAFPAIKLGITTTRNISNTKLHLIVNGLGIFFRHHHWVCTLEQAWLRLQQIEYSSRLNERNSVFHLNTQHSKLNRQMAWYLGVVTSIKFSCPSLNNEGHRMLKPKRIQFIQVISKCWGEMTL